jgi:hypothetical protein
MESFVATALPIMASSNSEGCILRFDGANFDAWRT